MLRVFDAPLTRWPFAVDRKTPVLIWIFYSALPGGAWSILSEAPIICGIFDASLARWACSILRKALVA